MSLRKNQPKIIVFTGGDKNNVDKGIIPASIGVLLKANGYHVTAIKMDPCYNLNSAKLEPSIYAARYCFRDGEIGSVNFGNYERILDQIFTTDNYITLGKINDSILKENELQNPGSYHGSKIYDINLVEETAKWIEKRVLRKFIYGTNFLPDICLIELSGGNDVDIISYNTFLKALSKFEYEHEFMHVHISELVSGETDFLKMSIQTMRSQIWKPHMIICKSPISDDQKNEIMEHTSLKRNMVISLPKVSHIKQVPIKLQEQNIYGSIADELQLKTSLNFEAKIKEIKDEIKEIQSFTNSVKIAIVGKYMTNPMKENEIYTDSYESMQHLSNIAAEKSCQCKVEFLFIRSQDLDDETNVETYEAAMKLLEESHGIIVPGAIGSPGFKGVMKTCKFAREKKKPYLGIALGFQCGVMEFAQNICGIYPDSNQKVEEEVLFDTKKSRRGQHTVIFLTENSKLFELYGRKNFIEERNWNQKEINPVHVPLFIKRGLKFVGIGIDEKENGERSQGLQNLMSYDEAGYIKTMDELCKSYRKTAPLLSMQIFELQDHPYYVGVLYGPKCSGDGLHPAASSPPFIGLIKAALHEKELLGAEKDLSLVNLNLPPAVLPSSTITAQKIIPKSDLIEIVNTKPALYAAGKFDNWIDTDYELEGILDDEFNYIRTLMDAFKQK